MVLSHNALRHSDGRSAMRARISALCVGPLLLLSLHTEALTCQLLSKANGCGELISSCCPVGLADVLYGSPMLYLYTLSLPCQDALCSGSTSK